MPGTYQPRGASHSIHALFLLNIGLQLFDGLATYHGLQLGWQEGNPLLRKVMEHWGIGWTLVVFKMKACTLLFFLHRLPESSFSLAALGVVAVCYFLFSFLPWLACLVLFPLP
jgi:hypothetical protein